MESKTEILALNHIYKIFGGNTALNNVSLNLYKGEVLSVVGENGAGKSTLMKIIAGAERPDSGTITLEGENIEFQSTLDALRKGISIIYQEPNIFSDLSVIENIFIGNEIKNGASLSWKKMYEETCKALEAVDVPIEVATQKMETLTIGTQQLVMIARCLQRQCKILILDEPTSILSHGESEKLYKIIERLTGSGVSVIYISHRIQEVLQLSDRIMILRDGVVTASDIKPQNTNESKIVEAMSGRSIDMNVYRQRDLSASKTIMEVERLSKDRMFQDINFSLKEGEILGFYGLVGSGRSEMARVIFGETKKDSGTIKYDGAVIENRSPGEAIARKLYYMPEDRGVQGLFSGHSVGENMSVSFLDLFKGRLQSINRKKENKAIDDNIKKYKIKTSGKGAEIMSLSGGNQQKVLFCRWLIDTPKVLILDEPTRGIDIATKMEIHEYIMDLAKSGVAVIVISSDMSEIMSVSDRLIVMYRGKIVSEFDRKDITEQGVLSAALGLVQEEAMP